MCQTLSELGQAAARLAQRFDHSLVPPGQLAQVLGDAGAIEKMMATVASLAAAGMARRGPRPPPAGKRRGTWPRPGGRPWSRREERCRRPSC